MANFWCLSQVFALVFLSLFYTDCIPIKGCHILIALFTSFLYVKVPISFSMLQPYMFWKLVIRFSIHSPCGISPELPPASSVSSKLRLQLLFDVTCRSLAQEKHICHWINGGLCGQKLNNFSLPPQIPKWKHTWELETMIDPCWFGRRVARNPSISQTTSDVGCVSAPGWISLGIPDFGIVLATRKGFLSLWVSVSSLSLMFQHEIEHDHGT